MEKAPNHFQIIVVGAGPVGALAALNLKQQGFDVLLIEARAKESTVTDKRTLALSYNSVQAFLQANVPLDDKQLTTISQVHVSQQNAFGRTLLDKEDMKLPYLGKVVDYKHIINACEQALLEQQVTTWWQTPVQEVHTLKQLAQVTLANGQTVTCQWLILAEGGQLTSNLPGIKQHEYRYEQSAVVTTVHFKQPPKGVAFERFADAGPMALLPYYDAYRLIWTKTPAQAEQLQNMSQSEWIDVFKSSFGERLGDVTKVDDISSFPLVLKQLNKVYSGKVICIGNAAQTMHPVAAQGLNLGVRDAQTLCRFFAEPYAIKNENLGKQYCLKRSIDAHSIVGFTHSLVTIFDHPNTMLKIGRGGVMSALDAIPTLRKKFTHHLLYGL